MRAACSCDCGRQLAPVRRQQRSSWTPPALLKKQPARATALIAHSTDYSATATDEGILLLPPKQQLQEEDLVNVFNYERDLQGKCVLLNSSAPLSPCRRAHRNALLESETSRRSLGVHICPLRMPSREGLNVTSYCSRRVFESLQSYGFSSPG